MRRELIAVDYANGDQLVGAGAGAKQLVILATDLLCEEVSVGDRVPAAVAEHLIAERILPACYRPRYDHVFLDTFHNTLEQTRNSLVGDLPSAGSTLGELACHAILGRARQILGEAGHEVLARAAGIDPGLPARVTGRASELGEGLELLSSLVIEDADVLYLFELGQGSDPRQDLQLPGATSDPAPLAFENWLLPFGNAPYPRVTYDGRAWAA